MSRSFRKTPITGFATAESEKEFKKIEHGRERVHVRSRLTRAVREDDYEMVTDDKKFGDPILGPKDGKTYHHIDDDFPVPRYQMMMK